MIRLLLIALVCTLFNALPVWGFEPILDTAHTVSAIITPEGGTIQTTDNLGQIFTLDIPKDALTKDTVIKITPLKNVSGIQMTNGLTAGLHIEPEGLQLWAMAALNVKLKRPIVTPNELPFSYRMDTKEYQAQILFTDKDDPTKIYFPIFHFSGYSVGEGTEADWNAIANQKPSDDPGSMTHEIAKLLKLSADGKISDENLTEAMQKIFDNYKNGPLAKLLADLATGPKCQIEFERLHSIFGLIREAGLFGVQWAGPKDAELTSVFASCTEEFEKKCDATMDPGMSMNLLHLSRNAELMGSAQGAELARDAAKRCGTFKVEFETKITVLDKKDHNESGRKSAYTVDWLTDMEKQDPPGGDQAPTDKFFDMTDSHAGNCTYTWDITGDDVQFMRVIPQWVIRNGEGEYGADMEQSIADLADFKVILNPGTQKENITMHCRGHNIPSTFQIWESLFKNAHQAEMSGDIFGTSSFTMKDIGQALVAEKKFERDLPTGGGGAKITEKTTLKIYHQPRGR